MRAALDLAIPLIQRWEGLHRRTPAGIAPYLCPANIWTIGWGATHYADGRPVQPGDPALTVAECEALLQATAPSYLAEALRASPVLAAHPRRLAAITSFVFNLGGGRYRASTLRRRVNAEDWPGAVEQLLRWDRAGGKRLRGLTLRRQAEAELLS